MFENKENRTELEELGEFGLINHLAQSVILKNSETIKGIGDDAAVIDNASKLTVVTTDMLVEGVHFDMMYSPLMHLGYKCVAVNVSDIYAMNAQPHQITISIAVSNRFSVEATLTDRTDMGVPMLLGRNSIKGRFIVHPGRSFILSRPKKKRT